MVLDLVNTDRYPIDQLEKPAAKTLTTRCAERFARDGVVALPDFLRPAAVNTIAAEVMPRLPAAFFSSSTHTVFLGDGRSAGPTNHPTERLLQTAVGSIANDRLPPAGALQRLYGWSKLTAFIGAVLGHDEFYCGADPLGALSVNVYGEGDQHGWHFDEAHFTVTLSIQEAESGGHFDYVNGLRGEGFVDSDEIGRVLDGDTGRVERLSFTPGTLLIFGGHDTMHRVSPIGGPTRRLVPVLTYDTVEGSTNSDAVRQRFWGRLN